MDRQNNLLLFILTIGVFGIINTEIGIVGILPLIADQFNIGLSQAGLLVSLFALAVAVSAPILPMLFSGVNPKKVMLLVLGVFFLGNVVSIFTSSFTLLLIARVVPAFLHPVYISIALTTAGNAVSREESPKAIAKVIMGVSAGMVLGVPVTSFIATAVSLEMALTFFAIVNLIAFISVWLFVPSMPVKEKLTYGAQLSILKRPIIWISIFAVIFLNSAMFGVFSFLSEFLGTITNISGETISFMLLLFGVTSILGNIIGGRLLSKNANKTVTIYPFVLGVLYTFMFFMGQFTVPMTIIILAWGILFALGNNISQYWITSAAPEAPEFTNGLFLACGNLGITIGTTVDGLFITGMGTQYIVFGGLLFLIVSLVFILLRTYMYSTAKQLARL